MSEWYLTAVFLLTQVLDVVPEDWSVAVLEKFLVSALRRTLHEKRQNKLIKSLCMGQNITVNAEWVDLVTKEKPFVQTDDVVPVPGSI
jgi:Vacuolar sorting protein 39 domain 2